METCGWRQVGLGIKVQIPKEALAAGWAPRVYIPPLLSLHSFFSSSLPSPTKSLLDPQISASLLPILKAFNYIPHSLTHYLPHSRCLTSQLPGSVLKSKPSPRSAPRKITALKQRPGANLRGILAMRCLWKLGERILPVMER